MFVHCECVYIERIGATESREAIRIPISQIQAVRTRAHVGSPFALPWPNTCYTYIHCTDELDKTLLYIGRFEVATVFLGPFIVLILKDFCSLSF